MSATRIPHLILSDNRIMPVIGLGSTADSPGKETTKQAVIEAIKFGYRCFDTASVYGSEVSLGQGIAEALKLGLIKSRDELFINSKLWCSDNHPDHVIPALQRSLRTLKLDYLDLYLIHWPISTKPGKLEFPFDESEIVPFDIKGVWAAMGECQKLGLAKSIGVSNFSCKKLENVLSFATIPPTVNQVEMNPSWQQKNLREYCKAKGIIITAYSPLGGKGASWGTNDVMDSQLLKEIAEAHGKSVAQVSLRWLYEQGVSFVVRSYNKERMKQNLEIFDWSLTENDYEKIGEVKQHRTTSLGDIWDGEVNYVESMFYGCHSFSIFVLVLLSLVSFKLTLCNAEKVKHFSSSSLLSSIQKKIILDQDYLLKRMGCEKDNGCFISSQVSSHQSIRPP